MYVLEKQELHDAHVGWRVCNLVITWVYNLVMACNLVINGESENYWPDPFIFLISVLCIRYFAVATPSAKGGILMIALRYTVNFIIMFH